MANTLDYLAWRGDLTFSASAFNEVDFFICSQLSTPVYTGIVAEDGPGLPLSQVVESYFRIHDFDESLGALQSKYIHQMLKDLGSSKRFGGIVMTNAVNKVILDNDEQFCAVTMLLPDDTICVSYRGTDDTLIGWKEDCNIAVMDFVPAQRDAIDYLEKVANLYSDRKIRICGHSKGGNLAMSASVNASKEIRDRIISVFNFDGPGFTSPFFEKPEYEEMKDRITTVLSQHSLVGVLMNQAGHIMYVTSTIKGPYAHDGFNWKVLGTKFIPSSGLSDFSAAFDNAVNDAVENMNEDEKVEFIETLFGTLQSKGSVTITDMMKLSPIEFIGILMSLQGDKKLHKFINTIVKAMTKELSLGILPKPASQNNA